MCVRERVCVWMCVWGRERFKMSWLSWNKNQLSFCWAALQFFFAPAPPQKMQQLAEFVTRHLLFSLFFAFSSLFHQQKKKNCCCRSNIVQVERFTAFFVCSYFDQNQDQEAEIHTSQKIYLTCVRMKILNQCNSLRVTAGIILSYYRAIIPPLWGIHRAVVVNQKLLPQRVQT